MNDFKGNKVEINTEEKFETASCIKTFILGTLFDEVEKGQIGQHLRTIQMLIASGDE